VQPLSVSHTLFHNEVKNESVRSLVLMGQCPRSSDNKSLIDFYLLSSLNIILLNIYIYIKVHYNHTDNVCFTSELMIGF
jgi:hypothetical protein